MRENRSEGSRLLQLCLLFIAISVSRLAAQEISPTLLTNAPAFGTFYWLSGIPTAPYPFDPSHGLLPIWSFNGVYYVDDVELLQTVEGGVAMRDSLLLPPPGGGGGGGGTGDSNYTCNTLTNFTVNYHSSASGLALAIAPTTNSSMALTIQSATNATCDVFGTTNMADLALPALGRTNWTWLTRARGDSTNFSWGETNWCERYFQLGTMTDFDNDGLTDAYEELVSQTATNAPNSPRALYEGVISNQNPNAWFKLNDTNLADAQAGQSLINGGGAWDVDAFAFGNSSFSFTNAGSHLRVGNVINGGTSNSQASMSLLFRSIEGYSSNTVRYVFCQGTNNSEFSAFFEPTNTSSGYPGSLKVKMAGQAVPILQSNDLVFGAWYYLALTWDETRPDISGAEVRWYLGRMGGTLNYGSINLTDGAVIGSNTSVYLGNRDSTNRALRGPCFGALDEIVCWNRELTDTEVSAQFTALSPLFQGPAKAFDLARWNLLLPVDKTNGLKTNNLALEISTGWLNSGFKYVDPADWTQRYFYLSTNNQIVFEAPWNGARSSTNGSGARSELRGTLADGNEDNWTLAGTNTLEATCTVISAGTSNAQKVIIGQIHEETPSNTVASFTVNYNFPNAKDVAVSYKTNSLGVGGDDKLILATNVNLLDLIHYKVQLRDDGTNASIHAEAFVNGVLQTAPGQQDRPLASSPSDGWHTNTFYFKAGCYFPNYPTGGVAKVTFSSLTATHQP